MPHQLPLIPLLPVCPGCKREVHVLGQWHPWSKHSLCRECSTRYPMPNIYESDRPRLYQDNTPILDDGRALNVAMENALHRLGRGCVLTLEQGMSREGLPCDPMKPNRVLYYECPRCVKDMKYETEIKRRGALHRLQRLGRNGLYAPERIARGYTLSMPFCDRCGAAHNERFADGEAKQYCQQCQDKITVETYYRLKTIFGGDDVEAIMDRIQAASPQLFERHILPDYWFELMIAEAQS